VVIKPADQEQAPRGLCWFEDEQSASGYGLSRGCKVIWEDLVEKFIAERTIDSQSLMVKIVKIMH